MRNTDKILRAKMHMFGVAKGGRANIPLDKPFQIECLPAVRGSVNAPQLKLVWETSEQLVFYFNEEEMREIFLWCASHFIILKGRTDA